MNFIKPYSSLIESGLQNLNLPSSPETLYNPQRYVLEGSGKRIRPVLTLLACGICGEKPERAVPPGLAVELIHNFTLIHDDIMDQAESRRGKASVHVNWDLPTAILSGDGMFVQACMQLQHLPDKSNQKEAYRIFFEGINSVCEGQALDMEFENREFVSVEEYLKMISGKTAALLSVSLELGGIVAKASPEKIEIFRGLGESLGLAFQIQDDLLDITGDPDRFGKKWGGDILEGKKTFLVVKTLECCNEDEQRWLLDCIHNNNGSSEVVNHVLELFNSYEIIQKTESAVVRYYRRAEELLNAFEDSPYKHDLYKLITFLKKREI